LWPAIAIHKYRLDEKHKMGAVLCHTKSACAACAHVCEARWSTVTPTQAKAGKDMIKLAPRMDPRAIDVVPLRLYAGSRALQWQAPINRVTKSRLGPCVLECDTAEGETLNYVSFA
jgi:hypothetical protein